MGGGNLPDIGEPEAMEVLAGQVVINMDGLTLFHTDQTTLGSEVSIITVVGSQQ